MPADTWTETRVETLKALWDTTPASQIARQLGRGITRNAVIGKAHRLGLPAKVDPDIRARRSARRAARHRAA